MKKNKISNSIKFIPHISSLLSVDTTTIEVSNLTRPPFSSTTITVIAHNNCTTPTRSPPSSTTSRAHYNHRPLFDDRPHRNLLPSFEAVAITIWAPTVLILLSPTIDLNATSIPPKIWSPSTICSRNPWVPSFFAEASWLNVTSFLSICR